MADPINVVLLLTHDTGRHLGVYGRGPATPNLDRLASEGVIFDNAYCTAPQCSPSRASIFTGMWPQSHGLTGLINYHFELSALAIDNYLPAVLCRHGYRTHLFGLQHESRQGAAHLGFEHAHSVKPHDRAETESKALDFFRDPPSDPFLAVVSLFETHRVFPEGADCQGDVKIPAHLPDAEAIRADVNNLNCSAETMDTTFGLILRAIDDARLRDNTLVIYTTDHGIAFPGAKAGLFDPGIEVALLMRCPSLFEGGRRTSALASNIDIYPTVLDLLGFPIPDTVQGRSLAPILHKKADAVNEAIHAEITYHGAYDPTRCVRTARHKYIRSYEDRPMYDMRNTDNGYTKTWIAENTDSFQRPRPKELLFDTLKDPLERNNIADDRASDEVLKQMRVRLDDWMRRVDDPLLSGSVPAPSDATMSGTPYKRHEYVTMK